MTVPAADQLRRRLRVFHFRAGVKVCGHCGDPLNARRRDAAAHPGCARELRRRRETPAARRDGGNGRVDAHAGVEGGAGAAATLIVSCGDVACPSCRGRGFKARVVGPAYVGLTAVTEQGYRLGPRKVLTCLKCEKRSTVARARKTAQSTEREET